MFIHPSTLLPIVASALVAYVAAAPNLFAARQDTSECSTGTIECCTGTTTTDDSTTSMMLKLYGVNAEEYPGLVGYGCSPISIGVGSGATCTQQPVCCNNNTFDGLVSIGCSPIGINL